MAILVALYRCNDQVGDDDIVAIGRSSLATDDFTQSLDLLLVLNKPLPHPHDFINDLDDTSETTRGALDLHKASNRQANFAAMLEDDEQLDTEGSWLEVQCVVLVDTRIDAVVLA